MSRPKSHIVSLGAGKNQIPLITAGKKLGYQVIGVDENPMAPGLSLCDIRINRSIYEHEEIYTQLAMLPSPLDIVGIFSRSYGWAGRSVSFLNQKMGFPIMNNQPYDLYVDKVRQKMALAENGGCIPWYLSLSESSAIEKEPSIPGPWLLKKAISHGKKDILYIENFQDLKERWKSIVNEKEKDRVKNIKSNTKNEANTEKSKNINSSNQEQWLLEAYISDCTELTIMGIVKKGKFFLIDVFEKITSGPPFFVEIGHLAPYPLLTSDVEFIDNSIQMAVQALGVEFGPLIVEAFFISKSANLTNANQAGRLIHGNQNGVESGYLIFNEIIPEFGGENLAESQLLIKGGYNIFREHIRLVCQQKMRQPLPYAKRLKNKHIGVGYFVANSVNRARNQKIAKIMIDSSRIKRNDQVVLTAQKGDMVSPAQNNSQRLGYYIAIARNRQQLRKKMDSYQKALHLEVEP